MAEQSNKIPTVFDSEEQQVGEVYARALLASVASEEADAVVGELESLVTGVIDQNRALELVLLNPKMPIESKWELIDRVFGGRMNGKLITFLKVVARRQRLNALRSIQRAATKLRDEAAGRVQVQVTVPQAMSDTERSALIDRLKQVFRKEVRLNGSVDGQLQTLRKTVGSRAESALRSAGANLFQAG
jgi:F-type H+-transporting ATPase subunit delta